MTMGEKTNISWTDHTFNAWRGCEHATLPDGSKHPGCDHCYAEAMAKRNPRVLGEWGPDGTRVMGTAAYWAQPLKWNAAAAAAGVRQRVFCQSLADVFEDWEGPIHTPRGRVLVRPYLESENVRANWATCEYETWKADGQGWQLVTMDDLRRELFKLIDQTPWLDWQILTKRPHLVRTMWPDKTPEREVSFEGGCRTQPVYRANVWLGTSISDQATADALVPELLRSWAFCRVLFLSAEPLLGRINLEHALNSGECGSPACAKCNVGWVIAGGESGPKHRVCELNDLLDIPAQCARAKVACFVKQDCGPRDGLQGRIPDDVWAIKQFPASLFN